MSDKKYIFNQAEGSDTANILIDGEIDSWWGVGLQSFAKDIANSNAKNISVQINSPGGSYFEGQAIKAYIEGSPYNINTSTLGLAASAATFPAMAGKKTSIARGSMFMIHNASSGAYGESKDLEKEAELLKNIDSDITNTYVNIIAKNGKLINGSREETRKQVEEWQTNETWFTAEQAVEHGFIQEVTDGVVMNKAHAKRILNSCSSYKNVPTEFLNNLQNIANMADEKPNVTNENKDNEQGFFKRIANYFSTPEGKEVIAAASQDLSNQKEAEIEAAKKLLIANGVKIGTDEKPEPREEEPEVNNEIEALKAKLAEAEKKAQRLEEEKAAAPASPAKELANEKKNNSPFNKEELAKFAQIENKLINR
ncbi:hypothetical protein AB832_06975 [Flavobacteriaceae bacterium (ex Bugula neritina AB1)]|nr:hypothetical protein AB832_06975 [Flavobacteriaceae bacterium (ex Bugula neritina AB1)]